MNDETLSTLLRQAAAVQAEVDRLWAEVNRLTGCVSKGETGFARVTDYLKQTSNRPASVQQICRQAKVSRGAVANLLYKTHKEHFVCIPEPGHKNRKLWRLKSMEAT